MAARYAHIAPRRQPSLTVRMVKLQSHTGCGDADLVSLVTLATAGLPCSEPSDSKSSPLWQNGRRVARVTLGCLKSKNTLESRRHPRWGPRSIMVLLLVSACSVCMAFIGMKQFQLERMG